MSIRMTSGASARHRSIASCPSAASPTTSMSSDSVEQRPHALAQDGVIVGDQDADPGHQPRPPGLKRRTRDGVTRVPSPGAESTSTVPAEQLHALAHAQQPEAALARRGRRQARRRRTPRRRPRSRSISSSVALEHLDEHRLGARVPGDVGDRLLHRRGRARSRARACSRRSAAAELAAHRDAPRLEVALGVPADRREQPEVVEHRRAQVEDQAVQLLERAHGERPGLRQAVARRRRRGQAAERGLDPHRQRAQRLARLVVQLAREPLALVFLRRDHLAQQFLAPLRRAPASCAVEAAAAPACAPRPAPRAPGWRARCASSDAFSATRIRSSDRRAARSRRRAAAESAASRSPPAMRSAEPGEHGERAPHAARRAPREEQRHAPAPAGRASRIARRSAPGLAERLVLVLPDRDRPRRGPQRRERHHRGPAVVARHVTAASAAAPRPAQRAASDGARANRAPALRRDDHAPAPSTRSRAAGPPELEGRQDRPRSASRPDRSTPAAATDHDRAAPVADRHAAGRGGARPASTTSDETTGRPVSKRARRSAARAAPAGRPPPARRAASPRHRAPTRARGATRCDAQVGVAHGGVLGLRVAASARSKRGDAEMPCRIDRSSSITTSRCSATAPASSSRPADEAARPAAVSAYHATPPRIGERGEDADADEQHDARLDAAPASTRCRGREAS